MQTIGGSLQLLKTGRTSPDGVLGFLHVRNELDRMPGVLSHYRSLGVSDFVVVDNSSDDGTLKYLEQQNDVHLFVSTIPYSQGKYGLNATNALLDLYGSGRWCLTVDADEYFIYPHCETKGLALLVRYLEREGYDSLFTILLDMYSNRSIAETTVATGQSIYECCPFYDGGPYEQIAAKAFPFFELRGGPRRRIFWDAKDTIHPPSVSKVPLVKWKKGYRYITSTHFMRPAPSRLADVTGSLLHFKYLADFHARAQLEATREEHYAGAREYKKYHQKMEGNPMLSLHYEGSRSYRKSMDLVQSGLIRSSPSWSFFM